MLDWWEDHEDRLALVKASRKPEPLDAEVYDDPEEAEMGRRLELRKSAAELLLVERAREWLLGE